MNEEDGTFIRCVKHPSQFFIGFCSSCLVERLSTFGSSKQSLEAPHSSHSEIVEVQDVVPASESEPTEIRVRRTLQLLFQLDDDHGVEASKCGAPNQLGLVNSNAYESESCVSHEYTFPNSGSVEVNNDTRTRTPVNDANAVVQVNTMPKDANKMNCLEKEKLTKEGASSWLSSILLKKGLKWRTRSLSTSEQMQDQQKLSISRQEDEQLEGTPNMHHSCDWRVCHDSTKSSWDPPRHSWDGSMVSKALACSFACLEEQHEDSKKTRRSSPKDAMSEVPNQTDGYSRRDRVGLMPLADENPLSSEGSLGSLFRERSHEEPHPEASVFRIKGKKSERWSKVWDWSITSPFRDFMKKREHTFERSLSESCQEGQNSKNTEVIDSEGGLQINGGSFSSARVNQLKYRGINFANGNLKILRPDWQKKRDFQLGKSRSAHYSSPGNLDNGLLRFYLTPLRSSRRYTRKSRAKKSIFGFY